MRNENTIDSKVMESKVAKMDNRINKLEKSFLEHEKLLLKAIEKVGRTTKPTERVK